MPAVWMRAQHELRHRWRGAIVLALLLGVAGGVIMTAAAGARRSASAFDRLLESSKAFDVEVQITGEAGPEVLDQVAALPQVADHGRLVFIPSTEATSGADRRPFSWDVSSVALVDPNIGRTLEIPRMSAGRFPRFDEPHEAMANETFARKRRLDVGDAISLQLPTFPQLLDLFAGRPSTPTGPVVTVRIAGIGRIPHDVSISEPTGLLILTPAFFETYSERAAHLWAMGVRLRNGEADVPDFLREGRRIAAEAGGDTAGEEVLSFRPNAQSAAGVERALGVQSSALWIFAGVVGAAALLVLHQAVGRWQTMGADDQAVLRSLGMGRTQRMLTTALPAAAIAAAAGVVGALTAVGMSALVPIGFARSIDPDVGFFADGLIMAIGGAALVILVALGGWIQAAVLAQRARGDMSDARARPSTAADLAARGGMPPTVVAGVRFGLEPGRGRSAVPVRSVLAGTVLSILAVVGAFVFGRSLDHMLSTPSNYGWNWDLVLFGGEDPTVIADFERKLSASRSVAEFSRATVTTTTFDERDLETLGVQPIEGSVLPSVLEGKYPVGADEVALASKTLRDAGLRLGDHVAFPGSKEACGNEAGCTVDFLVVGRVAHWGEGSDPDDGAAFTAAGQQRVRHSEGFTDFLVRIPDGMDRPAVLTMLERELGDATFPVLAPNLTNVNRVRTMPAVLASILAVLALATLIHALLMTARRKRYDLAVLKTLGFVRGQVVSTVAWQATTLVVLALIVGLPLGIVAGRWSWTLLASRLGVADAYAIGPFWILAGAAGTLILANAIALLPGRSAAKTQAALVLRTE